MASVDRTQRPYRVRLFNSRKVDHIPICCEMEGDYLVVFLGMIRINHKEIDRYVVLKYLVLVGGDWNRFRRLESTVEKYILCILTVVYITFVWKRSSPDISHERHNLNQNKR